MSRDPQCGQRKLTLPIRPLEIMRGQRSTGFKKTTVVGNGYAPAVDLLPSHGISKSVCGEIRLLSLPVRREGLFHDNRCRARPIRSREPPISRVNVDGSGVPSMGSPGSGVSAASLCTL
jgi:hypothetical protein